MVELFSDLYVFISIHEIFHLIFSPCPVAEWE